MQYKSFEDSLLTNTTLLSAFKNTIAGSLPGMYLMFTSWLCMVKEYITCWVNFYKKKGYNKNDVHVPRFLHFTKIINI